MSKRSMVGALVVMMVVSACGNQEPESPIRKQPSPTVTHTDAPAISLPQSPVPSLATTPALKPLPTSGPPLAQEAVRPPEAGERLYDQTGIRRIRGCFTSDQPPTSPAKVLVQPAFGSRQEVVKDERDEHGGGESTTFVLEYRADGIYLAFLRQQTRFPIESVIEFQPEPPVLVMPANPKDGQAWSFQLVSTDGSVKAQVDNKIDRASEAVQAGGSTTQATKKSSTSRVTGSSSAGTLDLTIQATSWYSPQRRLDIRSETATKGTAGLCEVDSQVTSVLRS